MAEGNDKKGSGTSEQHPYVERLRPDPSKPPTPVVALTGLLGRSDRSGHQRLYFTRDLGTYAEFPSADVLFVEPIPAAESPITGIDASRVTLSHDATVHYTRSTKANTLGDFDLDVRTARAGATAGPGDPIRPRVTFLDGPCDGTQITLCRGRTCIDICTDVTCRTDCAQATCNTCHTRCGTCQTCAGQNTCQTCQTCQTCAGQNTCQTCQTQCDTCDATCNTCVTDCRGRTCITCDTCNPHAPTCGPRCFPE
jgi:hypothetical protein